MTTADPDTRLAFPWRRSLPLLCVLWVLSARGDTSNTMRHVALDLAAEDQHEQAAIEFRRLALAAPTPADQAPFYWAAAYEYSRSTQHALVSRMLDRVDDADLLVAESLLLRGESALSDHRPEEARFYFQSLETAPATPDETHEPFRAYAGLRLARLDLLSGSPDAARERLKAAGRPEALSALDAYRAGRDKSPQLGGWLGLIPGLGYAYSGEYGNALRSLILNGLFIFAMVESAEEDQWGPFAVAGFFELTWYTGSVYGGIDSAHRFNQARLDSCLDGIDGALSYTPDFSKLPALSIRFSF